MTDPVPSANDRVSAAATSIPPDEALELFQRNMAFFQRDLEAFYRVFLEYTPRKQLVWLPDGEVNVRGPQGLIYSRGARAEHERQAKQAIRGPQQMVLAGPKRPVEAMRQHSLRRREELQQTTWATQYYDDRSEDAHTDDFIVDAWSFMDENGFELADMPVTIEPYFYVAYGLGLGIGLQEILEHYKPRVFVICEMDVDLFYLSAFMIDWEKLYRTAASWGGKVLLNMALTAAEIYRSVAGIVINECVLGFDGICSHVHLPCDPALRIAAAEFHSQRTGQFASFLGFTVDEYNMMKNTFRNLRPGTKRVLNEVMVPAELPVVIVASGPSVHDTIDFIREVQDRAIIISCGSSLRILTREGIKPDFHCNLERGKAVLDLHLELEKEADLSDIYTVMTTTIWPGIDAHFKDAIYFFRSALSPIGVFCDHPSEILHNEGPTVTSTAMSLAVRLKAPEIYLCGVDLGAVDPKRSARSKNAWGMTPWNPTIPVRGNFGNTVFTDDTLVRQRLNLEEQIRQTKANVYNLSNGVRIDGTLPARPGYVRLKQPAFEKATHTAELVQQFPVYTRERFESAWMSSQVRDGIPDLVKELRAAFLRADDWTHQLMADIEACTTYSNMPFRRQYAPRLMRGSLLSCAQHFQAMMLRVKDQSRRKELFEGLREQYLSILERMEREAYGLADELEAEDGSFGVLI